MSNQQVLGSLSCGQEATVVGVHGSNPVMMRLMEIGLIPGRTVSVLRRAPFGGPVELLVDQTRIAVRNAEADCVEVTSVCAHVSLGQKSPQVPAEPVAV